MPLYTYVCGDCNHEFDEIVALDKRDEKKPCKLCQGESERKVAVRFGFKSAIDPRTDTVYTPKEIDRVVGEKAEKKWEGYDKRWEKRYKFLQDRRRGGRKAEVLDIPRESDGTYRPVKYLGNEKQKALREEYSTALKEHREERKKKGLSQFDGPGSIVE